MTTEPLLRINPTRVRRFYRCEYEWFVRDVQGVDPLRGPASPHRDRGKVFHALLEYALRRYADTGVPFTFDGDEGMSAARGVMLDIYAREQVSLPDEACYEVLGAARYQLTRLDLAAWEVVRLPSGEPLIEADLRANVDDVEVQARVDVVMRHRSDGLVWLIDFKSTLYPIAAADVPPFTEHDDQLLLGRYVLAANGIKVDVSALLHLRSVPPKPPHVVYAGKKNERTSQNVNDLACDWELYRDTLIERGEDPTSEAALKVRDALQQQCFARWQVDITSAVGHDATAENLRRVITRMKLLAEGRGFPIRRMSWGKHRSSCDHCDYGRWCRASLRAGGADPLHLLGTEYEARESSPLAGQEHYDAPAFTPEQAYVAWAREQGREIQPHQEFTP